jgi:hypothetical protein
MTDSSADRDPKDSDPHIEPSFSAGEDSSASGDAPGAMAVVKEPSKEIVLQRLTSHSSWDDPALGDAKPSNGSAESGPNARRYLSMAAVVALAALVGAVGGSAATFGIAHYLSDDGASALAANQYRATQSAVAKLASDVAALKTSAASHAAKVDDRVGKIEKAQAEPAAKLAKLSEAVEKLRAAEATGSVAKPATAAAPTPAPAVNRLPIVNGWALLGVGHGSATVEGRDG